MSALARMNGDAEEWGSAETGADKEISKIAANATVKRLSSGETLYVEGDRAPYCFQIVSGAMKEYNTLEDGRRQVADFYGPGDLFGISETDHQLHTAEAITDCVVRVYPRDTFLRIVAGSQELSQHLLDTFMTRLHRARDRIVMLGRMGALQRVATFLRRVARDQSHSEACTLVMSRQDMADHLGLTIETVCRSLTELKKRGAVSMESARVFTILDMHRLEEIAAGAE